MAVELQWHGDEVWRLPQWRGSFVFEHCAATDTDAIPESALRSAPLHARSRAGGERMKLSADTPGRTLKNLFQECGVPAWKRDVPLLFIGETLLFVPLIGVNRNAWQMPDAQACRRIVWRPDLLIA
jgi:tRNA(Ile)-lysidine synthase